jgi:hypothetical protein
LVPETFLHINAIDLNIAVSKPIPPSDVADSLTVMLIAP